MLGIAEIGHRWVADFCFSALLYELCTLYLQLEAVG